MSKDVAHLLLIDPSCSDRYAYSLHRIAEQLGFEVFKDEKDYRVRKLKLSKAGYDCKVLRLIDKAKDDGTAKAPLLHSAKVTSSDDTVIINVQDYAGAENLRFAERSSGIINIAGSYVFFDHEAHRILLNYAIERIQIAAEKVMQEDKPATSFTMDDIDFLVENAKAISKFTQENEQLLMNCKAIYKHDYHALAKKDLIKVLLGVHDYMMGDSFDDCELEDHLTALRAAYDTKSEAQRFVDKADSRLNKVSDLASIVTYISMALAACVIGATAILGSVGALSTAPIGPQLSFAFIALGVLLLCMAGVFGWMVADKIITCVRVQSNKGAMREFSDKQYSDKQYAVEERVIEVLDKLPNHHGMFKAAPAELTVSLAEKQADEPLSDVASLV